MQMLMNCVKIIDKAEGGGYTWDNSKYPERPVYVPECRIQKGQTE